MQKVGSQFKVNLVRIILRQVQPYDIHITHPVGFLKVVISLKIQLI